MGKYEISDPRTGLSVNIEAERAPTSEEAEEFWESRKESGVSELRQGLKRKGASKESILQENAAKALGIPKGQFNPKKGAGKGIRAKIDFLRDEGDRVQYLKREFGEGNVRSLNIDGNPTTAYKDPDAGEWRLVDEIGLSLADVTSDIAGSIAPTVATVASGVAAAPSIVGSGLAAGAANMAVGSTQDAIARKMLGFDIKGGDILKDRAFETAIQVPVDMLTMKAGRVLSGLVGRQGKDLAAKEMDELLKAGYEVPSYGRVGEKAIGQARTLESNFPKSQLAKNREMLRDDIAQDASSMFKGEPVDFQKSYGNIYNRVRSDYDKIAQSLDVASSRKEAANLAKGSAKSASSIAERKAASDAKKIFSDRLKSKIKSVAAPRLASPEDVGKSVQSNIFDKMVNTRAQTRMNFEKAYEGLRNVKTSGSRISDIFSRNTDEAIRGIESDIIGDLNAESVKKSGRVIDKLKDLDDITFKQLNDIIQLVEVSTKRGAAIPGFQAGKMRRLGDALRQERSALLDTAPKRAKTAFEKANTFFQDVDLKFRESDLEKLIKPELGDSVSGAVEARLAGEAYQQSSLKSGGTAVSRFALKNPKALQDTLRATSRNPTVIKQLREVWLSNKGITGDSPVIPKLSGEDMDMAKALLGGKKFDALKDAIGYSGRKDEIVDGVTRDTLDRIVNSNYDLATKEAVKAAKAERAAKEKLDNFLKDTVIKKMIKGDAPVPDSADEFIPALLKMDSGDVDKFTKKLTTNAQREEFASETWRRFLQLSGQGTDAAQVSGKGEQLWNPKQMRSLLDKHEGKLKSLWGEERYKQVKMLNNGMDRFGMSRFVDEAIGGSDIGSAARPDGGITLFFTQIPRHIKERVLTSAWGNSGAFKALPNRPFKTADEFDQFVEQMIKGTFIGTEGIRASMQEANKDPEYRQWLTDQYNQ